jgi:hypothetical protein
MSKLFRISIAALLAVSLGLNALQQQINFRHRHETVFGVALFQDRQFSTLLAVHGDGSSTQITDETTAKTLYGSLANGVAVNCPSPVDSSTIHTSL